MRDLLRELLNNRVLILSLISLVIAQVLKILTYLIIFRKWDFSRVLGSGGMPSSHSSFVTTLSMSVGLIHGFESTLFAMSFVFALIIMYDASGVRLAVGKQAKLLNEIQDVINVISSTELKTAEKLKELVGHTKLEVLTGFILGIIVSLVGCSFLAV